MIKTESLKFFYQSNKIILDGISFRAQKGVCVAVLGNNGAGKSTLLSCLNRIIRPQHGVVHVNKNDIMNMKGREIAKHIAYVSQRSETARFTVFDAILLGRKPYISISPTGEDYDMVESINN